MTNFPSCFTTEGLKVPADSNLSPCGETMGSAQSRGHLPKGGEEEMGAIAVMAMAINATRANALAARIAERGILFFMRLPSLTKQLRWKTYFLWIGGNSLSIKTRPATG